MYRIKETIMLFILSIVECNEQKFRMLDFINIPIIKDFERYQLRKMKKEAVRNGFLCIHTEQEANNCCQCGKHCLRALGTCCADALWKEKSFSNISSYREYFMKQVYDVIVPECSEVFPYAKYEIHHHATKYMVYNKCRKGATEEEEEKCRTGSSNIKSSIPVLDEKNHAYKNLFCAACHSVDEFSMSPVIITSRKDIHAEYNVYLLAYEQSIRDECKNPYNDDCDASNIFYAYCKAFVLPYGSYKNIFCYLCENEKKFENKEIWTGSEIDNCALMLEWFHAYTRKEFRPKFYTPGPSFEGLQNNVEETSLNKLLQETWLHFNICPQNYTEVNGKCVKNLISIAPHGITNAQFDTCFFQEDNTLFIVNNTRRTGLEFIDSFLGKGISKEMFTKLRGYNKGREVHRTNTSLNESDVREMLNHTTRIKNYLKNNEILILSSTSWYSRNANLFEFSQIFPGNKICHSPVDTINEEIEISDQCNITVARNESYNNVSFWIEISNKSVIRHITFCRKFHLSTEDCPIRLINSSAERLHVENHTLILTKNDNSTETFKATQYILLDQDMYGVCQSLPIPIHVFMRCYTVITFCLANFLFYIYVILSHRKQEISYLGGGTLSIYSWLTVSDIFFLIDNILLLIYAGEKYQEFCSYIHPVYYFFTLLHQTWGVVLAYDVYQKVTVGSTSNDGRFGKEMVRYHLLTLLPPLVIVIIETFVNEERRGSRSDVFAPCSYGGDLFGKVIFIYTPALLTLTISTTTLLVALNRVPKVLNNEQPNTKHKKPLFALTLIFICTVSDLLGYIDIQKEDASRSSFFIQSLYSIIRALRGVMLCSLLMIGKRYLNFDTDGTEDTAVN